MSTFWDEKFAAETYVYGQQPNAYLVSAASRLSAAGAVLVPGDGEGRNGVWLARQGLTVLSVDSSAVGLAKARTLAEQHGVSLTTEQADLLTWDWPVASMDAVVSIFLHFGPADRPAIHAAMAAALRPGGLLILEAFRPAQLSFTSGGPKDPAMLYTADALRADFAALTLLELDETETDLDEGPFHQGRGAVVRLIAQKA